MSNEAGPKITGTLNGIFRRPLENALAPLGLDPEQHQALVEALARESVYPLLEVPSPDHRAIGGIGEVQFAAPERNVTLLESAAVAVGRVVLPAFALAGLVVPWAALAPVLTTLVWWARNGKQITPEEAHVLRALKGLPNHQSTLANLGVECGFGAQVAGERLETLKDKGLVAGLEGVWTCLA